MNVRAKPHGEAKDYRYGGVVEGAVLFFGFVGFFFFVLGFFGGVHELFHGVDLRRRLCAFRRRQHRTGRR